MNIIEMSLTGDDSSGWTWRVCIDDCELFRTEPLAREDLGAGLLSIGRDSSRENPYLSHLSDQELFFVLDGFFFGALNDALRASAEEQVWARHLVSPVVPAAVWSRMYLIGSSGDQERLLVWREGNLASFAIPKGSFDKQLTSAIERLEGGIPPPPE